MQACGGTRLADRWPCPHGFFHRCCLQTQWHWAVAGGGEAEVVCQGFCKWTRGRIQLITSSVACVLWWGTGIHKNKWLSITRGSQKSQWVPVVAQKPLIQRPATSKHISFSLSDTYHQDSKQFYPTVPSETLTWEDSFLREGRTDGSPTL